MTAISNFTQAVRELTGFDDNPPKGSEAEANEKATRNEVKMEELTRKQSREIRTSHELPKVELSDFDTDGGSLITRSMSISGQIDCKNQLKVIGKVSGEIQASNAVSVNGIVIGNVNAESLSVMGKIKGDISAKNMIRINDAAVVVGDMQADNLCIYGRIKGNLTVQATTEVAEGALVVGDIVTGSLASSRGSIIDGKIIIKDKKPFNFDEENLFKIEE